MNIRYLISKYSDLLAELEVNRLHWVKKRKNGLTGSGKAHMCHWNVAKIIGMYGGQMSTGYTLEILEDGDILFMPHSVWYTPEGQYACITNYGTGNKYTLFAETGKFNPLKQDLVRMHMYYATLTYKKSGIKKCKSVLWDEIMESPNVGFEKVRESALEQVHYNSGFIGLQHGNDNWNKSGFSKPSTANGLSWEELCNRSSA